MSLRFHGFKKHHFWISFQWWVAIGWVQIPSSGLQFYDKHLGKKWTMNPINKGYYIVNSSKVTAFVCRPNEHLLFYLFYIWCVWPSHTLLDYNCFWIFFPICRLSIWLRTLQIISMCIFFPSGTKQAAHRLKIIFGLAGFKSAELHGNLTQVQRLEVSCFFLRFIIWLGFGHRISYSLSFVIC